MTAWGRVKVAGVTSLWSRLRHKPVFVELDGELMSASYERVETAIVAESRPSAILLEIFVAQQLEHHVATFCRCCESCVGVGILIECIDEILQSGRIKATSLPYWVKDRIIRGKCFHRCTR